MRKESFQGILLGVVIMCAVFAFITVAWAAFSSTLTINGTATIEKQSWKVEFSKTAGTAFTPDSSVAYQMLTPTLVGAKNDATDTDKFKLTTSSQAAGFIGTLTKPGDSITYSWFINNLGTFDANVALTGAIQAVNSIGSNVALTCTYKNAVDSSTDASAFCNNNVIATLKVNGSTVATTTDTYALNQGTNIPVELKIEYKVTTNSEGIDISALAAEEISVSLASAITATATQKTA